MKIDKKYKYIISSSLIIVLIPTIFLIINLLFCTDNFGCFFFYFLPILPGIMLNKILNIPFPTHYIFLLISNLIIYSFIGAGIGYLIYYLKFERKEKKNRSHNQ